MEKIKLPPIGGGTQIATSNKIKLPPINIPVSQPQKVDTGNLPLDISSNFEPVNIDTSVSTTPIAQKGEGIVKPVIDGVKSVITHPITTIIGAGKGTIDAFMGIEQGITKLVGADKASEYIKNNREALNTIVDTNLNPENSKEKSTAIAVGNFVGEQVPYLLGGEVAGLAGKALALKGLAETGKLSLKAVENIGKSTKLASEAAGFMGLDQITYTPEEGSRVDVLKKDALVLGTLGIIGEGISALKNSKAIQNIRNYADTIKTEKPSVPVIEANVKKLNEEVKLETGKTPQELIKENIQKAPEIKPETKPTEIPKGQEPLYQEARKYKNAEEFVKATKTKSMESMGISNEQASELFKGVEQTQEAVSNKLTDIWNKANEIQPKTESIKVSRGQLPVGEGKVKTTGLENRIKSNFESAPEEIKSSLSTFNQMNNKDQIAKAIDYVSKNPDEAMEVLRGNKPAPKGLLNNSIYVAMTHNAETNSELAAKLASLRSTRYGQEIEILKEIDKNNPVKYMTDLVRNKIEVLGGQEKLNTLRNQEMGTVKRAISKSNLSKTDWNSFVESITC